MRRLPLVVASVLVAACADDPATPSGAAAPLPDSARVTASGRLIGLDLRPPCPPGTECEACQTDNGLVFAGASGLPVRAELADSMPDATDRRAVGPTYTLTVDARPYTSSYLSGAWLAAYAPRQSLALRLVALRETE